MNYRLVLGRNLRRVREQRRLSQSAFSAVLSIANGGTVSGSYISSLEHGHENPTLRQLERLAEALGVSIETLFDRGGSMATAEIVPLGDRIKVLPLKPASMTKGGILLPESSEARDRPLEGLVLAVGRGRQLDTGTVVALECEVGDLVQFGKYAGIYVFDEVVGADILLMREDEALGRKLASTVLKVAHGQGQHVVGDPRCELCNGR